MSWRANFFYQRKRNSNLESAVVILNFYSCHKKY
jgi:hypothetical protein